MEINLRFCFSNLLELSSVETIVSILKFLSYK